MGIYSRRESRRQMGSWREHVSKNKTNQRGSKAEPKENKTSCLVMKNICEGLLLQNTDDLNLF
jgi:hypothetical protein